MALNLFQTMATDDRDGMGAIPLHILSLWWRVVRITYLRFCFSGTLFMAAAIAFFSIICLGPLGLLMATALQRLLGPGSDAYARIQEGVGNLGSEAAQRIMPQVDGLIANPDAYVTLPPLSEFLANPNAWIPSLVGIITVIWAGLRLFEMMERSLTEIWPGKLTRGFLTRKLVAFNTMIVAGLLLTSFMMFNALFASVRSWLMLLPEIDIYALDAARPRFLLAYQFVLAFIAFGMLYKFMPVQRVPYKTVVAGAVCAAVIWLAASHIFTMIIGRSQHYGAIYGGLAGVVIFALWSFIGTQALLIGGHFAVAYEHVFIKAHRASEDDMLIGLAQRQAEKLWATMSVGGQPGDSAPAEDLDRDPQACELRDPDETINGFIIAGGTLPPDFAAAVGTSSKGLIEVLGRPSIDYVIDAMRGVPNMGKLIIIGPRELYADHPVAQKVDDVVEDGDSIAQNLIIAAEALGPDHRILMATSDTPLLTSESLCTFLDRCPADSDLCYPLTRREPTQKLFGDRTWVFLPLREGWITHTCNVLFSPSVVTNNIEFIDKFITRRRNQWTAAATVGFGFLLRFALSWQVPFLRYSMAQIADRMERITKSRNFRGIILDYPEMALDIDHASDVPVVEKYLRQREPVKWPPGG